MPKDKENHDICVPTSLKARLVPLHVKPLVAVVVSSVSTCIDTNIQAALSHFLGWLLPEKERSM